MSQERAPSDLVGLDQALRDQTPDRLFVGVDERKADDVVDLVDELRVLRQWTWQSRTCSPRPRRYGRARHERPRALPARVWTEDPDRLTEAGVPDGIEFANTPTLATGMPTRALRTGVPGALGHRRWGLRPRRPGRRTARHAWQQHSAGPGARGRRIYEWAWIYRTASVVGEIAEKLPDDPFDTRRWSLLLRRHPRTGELAFHRCHSPDPVPLRELVRVVGRRWSVKDAHRNGKGPTGLDEHHVRRGTSWNTTPEPATTAAAATINTQND